MIVAVGRALRHLAPRAALPPDIGRATRATVGFMLPLLLHVGTGWPAEAVYACIAAQHVAMLDVRGDYRLRVSLLATVTVLLCAVSALGAFASVHVALAVAAVMVVALGLALVRHVASDYGSALSAALMLTFLLSLAGAQQPGDMLAIVLTTLIGGGMGVAIQTLLWPVNPQHPLRRVVSDSWTAAANLFQLLAPDRTAPNLPEAEANVRTSLDQAARVLASVSRRQRASGLPGRLEALNLLAARLTLRVVALRTALDGLNDAPLRARVSPALAPVFVNLVNTARSVAVAVVSRQPSHLATCEVRMRRLEALLEAGQARLAPAAPMPSAGTLAELLERVRETIPEILAALRTTMDRAAERAAFAVELFDVETWQLKPLASALNFTRRVDPALIRFGFRLAVMTGLATFVYRWLELPHGYWIPFTIVVIMQPDFGSTRRMAAARLGGTLAGSAAASGLLWLHPPQAVRLALIGAGVFGFTFYLKRRYSIAVFFVTIFVVLLLAHGGEGDLAVGVERIGATLAGGLVALAAALLFWPVWESDRFPAIFARALQATRDYLALLHNRLREGTALDEPIVKAKRHAESAGSMVFSSLGRIFADAHTSRVKVENSAALANGNQRILRVANLLLVTLRNDVRVGSPAIDQYFHRLDHALEALALHAGTAKGAADDLAACAREIDTLPSPPADASAREGFVLAHLARAATETRAMIAASTA